MAAGLARQLDFCADGQNSTSVDTNPTPTPAPEWCADADFVQTLRNAQERLWTSIRGAKDRESLSHYGLRAFLLTRFSTELYSEVWSYSFDNATNTFSVADLAALSPSGTESDAIPLWSYGFLAIADPSGDSTRAS